MSNRERIEELASLRALDLLDEAGQQEIETILKQEPELKRVLQEYAETVAALAYYNPEVPPPAVLKHEILSRLSPSKSKVVYFPSWIPFALAAGLMFLALYQARTNWILQHQLSVSHHRNSELLADQGLREIQIANLQAQAPTYSGAHVVVLWDTRHNKGLVSSQGMPAVPPGHDYQLWILDPATKAPISAGVLPSTSGESSFGAATLTKKNLNFAISLEPSGGRPSPTGPILFASSNK